MNFLKKINRFFRGDRGAPESFRVFLDVVGGETVQLGEFKDVTPAELDEQIQMAYAQWFWDRITVAQKHGETVGATACNVRYERI